MREPPDVMSPPQTDPQISAKLLQMFDLIDRLETEGAADQQLADAIVSQVETLHRQVLDGMQHGQAANTA
jgi:predicted glycosyltransferase